MTEYRASFDASVSFSNGGDLAVHGPTTPPTSTRSPV